MGSPDLPQDPRHHQYRQPPSTAYDQPPYGQPPAWPGSQQQPPSTPVPGPRPVQVNLASIGMFVIVGLSLVHAVVGLIALNTVTERGWAGFPQSGQPESDAFLAFLAFSGLLAASFVLPFVALHAWLGFMIRKPRNWARIAATVLLAVTAVTGSAVEFSGTAATVLIELLGLSMRPLAIGLIVLLWLPPSNAYFAAVRPQLQESGKSAGHG